MGWAKYLEDNIEMFNDREFENENNFYSNLEPVVEFARYTLNLPNKKIVKKKQKLKIQKFLEKKICKCCQTEFKLTRKELKFFERKQLEIPKRCLPCRQKRKMATKITAIIKA